MSERRQREASVLGRFDRRCERAREGLRFDDPRAQRERAEGHVDRLLPPERHRLRGGGETVHPDLSSFRRCDESSRRVERDEIDPLRTKHFTGDERVAPFPLAHREAVARAQVLRREDAPLPATLCCRPRQGRALDVPSPGEHHFDDVAAAHFNPTHFAHLAKKDSARPREFPRAASVDIGPRGVRRPPTSLARGVRAALSTLVPRPTGGRDWGQGKQTRTNEHSRAPPRKNWPRRVRALSRNVGAVRGRLRPRRGDRAEATSRARSRWASRSSTRRTRTARGRWKRASAKISAPRATSSS